MLLIMSVNSRKDSWAGVKELHTVKLDPPRKSQPLKMYTDLKARAVLVKDLQIFQRLNGSTGAGFSKTWFTVLGIYGSAGLSINSRVCDSVSTISCPHVEVSRPNRQQEFRTINGKSRGTGSKLNPFFNSCSIKVDIHVYNHVIDFSLNNIFY